MLKSAVCHSGVWSAIRASWHVAYVDFRVRYGSARDVVSLVAEIVLALLLAEGLLICVGYAVMLLSAPTLVARLIGAVLGACIGLTVPWILPDRKLRFWSRTVAGFRVDIHRLFAVVPWAVIVAGLLAQSWLVWHSFDLLVWYALAVWICLFVPLCWAGECSWTLMPVLLVTLGAGLWAAIPIVTLIALIVCSMIAISALHGPDRMRFALKTGKMPVAHNAHTMRPHIEVACSEIVTIRRLHERSLLHEPVVFLRLLLTSLPRPASALVTCGCGLLLSVALAIWGSWQPGMEWSGSVGGFILAMTWCDQIGVNLVASQRLRLMWMRREGLDALHVLRVQIGVFFTAAVVSSSLISVISVFVVPAEARPSWGVTLMTWIGQCAWYAGMAASAVLLSERCRPVDSGLYAIGMRPALVFAVICAVGEAMLLLMPAAFSAVIAVALCAVVAVRMRTVVCGFMAVRS